MVRTTIGTPASSANCLTAGAGSAPCVFAAALMRVPKPAAGIMTNTFMKGERYSRRVRQQRVSALLVHRALGSDRLRLACGLRFCGAQLIGAYFRTSSEARRALIKFAE